LVSATNIISHGSMEVGEAGLLRLTGKNVDLSRSALIAGDPFSSTGGGGGGFFFNTNYYFTAGGITELYWGAGQQTNDLQSDFGLTPPDVFSPIHTVFSSGSTNGFRISLPDSFNASFKAFANMDESGTNKIIQVVFVNTNFGTENITADVTFSPIRENNNPNVPNQPEFRGLRESVAIVQFSAPSFDPISGRPKTNAISLIDSSAQQTNIVLFTNFFARSFSRPSSYEIFTSALADLGLPGNTPYTPDLIYPGSTYSSNVVVGYYGAYSARLGGTANATVSNVATTNQAPRIEINADKLDLSRTRIRSEGPVVINAKHVAGRTPTAISSGLLEANLGSTNGSLVISNIFPQSFARLRGSLSAYSFVWQNTETNDLATNNIKFHVLILDQNLTASSKPLISGLVLRSTNLVIHDDLTLNQNFRFETENLTVDSTISLISGATDFHSTNFVGVKNFVNTENGVIQGANEAFFGYDTPAGFETFLNQGLITAVAPFFKAGSFENSGTITSFGGSILIQAKNADLSNGSLLADRDVQISAGNLIATNSTIIAGQPDFLGNLQFGRLTLNVTNSITDFGLGANNIWQVTEGFVFPRKPFQGDLLGTEIRTIASGFQEIAHLWPGEDLGTGSQGYNNNLALGHLILDIQSENALLRFTGTGSQNALYVVTLDVEFGPLVDVNTSINNLLAIDDNLRIYYINSNVGDKLSKAFPDRVIQVADFGVANTSGALIVQAKGLGIITPNLNGKNLKFGANYKMKATPAVGNIFAGWSGSTNSSSALLKFKMRRNMILEANFVRNPFDAVKGSYNGLYFDSANGIRHESSGIISFNVSKKGVVTGQLLSGKPYRFSGTLDVNGTTAISVIRRGNTTLTLNLQLDLATNSDEVHGTVSSSSWTSTFDGGRAASDSVSAGQYTMIISGNEISNGSGDGFGTFSVDGSGHLRFAGTLADGTKINQQVNVYKNGLWPFYVPLYKGAGSILSLITLPTGESTTISGDATWFKTGNKGFTNETTVIGSHYSPPAKGGRSLAGSSAVVILGGGNLSASTTNNASLENGRIVTDGTNRLTISINPANGVFNGSFVHPETKDKTLVKGVVLQQQNSARGFFLGTNQSGSVLLEAK
ncbi:MAG: hypothetical protein ABIV39_07555, partial [Verrucomicrobiota bacterium]